MELLIANCQYTALADERATCDIVLTMMAEAAEKGADMICLPECASRLDPVKTSLIANSQTEDNSDSLAILRDAARQHKTWVLIGSLLLKSEQTDDMLVNRSYLITPDGDIRARYDKIHMFDVSVNDGQNYQESRTFIAGDRSLLVQMDGWRLGMTICYDLRFPYLYRQLAQHGADVITIPAAFTKVTGTAHWHSLMRARAIENGVFIVSPAQTGTHAEGRQTYGHALVVDPWGNILSDAGTEQALTLTTINLDAVAKARAAIPSLKKGRENDIRLELV
ncbi:MAG: carbon-nitrogen hydrolase family protein [Pseudomonadota bacterium]|nr:carbon-nitrogen hydrolase family protein [Pseudomonadota bacterium]